MKIKIGGPLSVLFLITLLGFAQPIRAEIRIFGLTPTTIYPGGTVQFEQSGGLPEDHLWLFGPKPGDSARVLECTSVGQKISVKIPSDTALGQYSIGVNNCRDSLPLTVAARSGISSITPQPIRVGETFEINGFGFETRYGRVVVGLRFKGTGMYYFAQVIMLATNRVVARVPEWIGTGSFTVTVFSASGYIHELQETPPFWVQVLRPGPAPILYSVSRSNARVGEDLTLKGLNFNDWNVLLFQSATPGAVSVAVPVAAENGSITVAVPSLKPGWYNLILDNQGGTLSNPLRFYVQPSPPKVTSITQSDGGGVKVQGENLGSRVRVYVTDPYWDIVFWLQTKPNQNEFRFNTTGAEAGNWLLYVYCEDSSLTAGPVSIDIK